MTYHLPIAASALSILIASTAVATVNEVREIDVTVDIAAIENETAAAYWGSLEGDMEAALGLRLNELLAEDAEIATGAGPGTRVLVDIRTLELASAFSGNLDISDAVLAGQVNIVDLTDNSNNAGYELRVSLESAGVMKTSDDQVMVLSLDDRVTYQLLVDTFADGVVDRLDIDQ